MRTLFLAAFCATVMLVASGCTPRPAFEEEGATLEAALVAYLDSLPEGAFVALAVKDPHRGIEVSIHGDTLLHAASTMKVPVMVEVFRQAYAGQFSLEDTLEVRNTFRSIYDGSEYRIEVDSDDSLQALVGQFVTIRELNERMVTVSANLATNLLIDLVSADSIMTTLQRIGASRMQVLRGVEDGPAFRAGLNNRATANDLATVMLAIGEGRAVSPEADAEMRAVLGRQRFRGMIPAGVPDETWVGNKTGWITGIVHDAALVQAPGTPAYALVILTRGFATLEEAEAVGAALTRIVHDHVRPTGTGTP